MKYVRDLREHFQGVPLFSMRDALVFLSKKGISRAYAQLLMHNLVKRKEVNRISKGKYSFVEEMQHVGLAFAPYYYGLQNALALLNVGTQETNPVVITPRKVRPGVRQYLGNNFVVRRIARPMFFGFDVFEYHGSWLFVSDLEKTLIDFAYFREPLDAETLAELKARLDAKKLNNYLKRCTSRVKKAVEALLKR